MRRILFLTLLLAPCDITPTLAQETGPPSAARPCSAPEHSQFDFWIGDWVVTRPDRTPAGVNRIQSILAGGLEDGVMVLRGEAPLPEAGTTLHEISWTPLEGGRVRQHWRISHDGGETWSDVFVGLYSPRQLLPTAPSSDPEPPGG